jgi:catechol 2,3-dioxygenase-like lactoylglutathione lyase family enzyme
MSETKSEVWFNGVAPILRVDDMQRSLNFYVDRLGFSSAPWGTDDFTYVSRDKVCIYLCRGDQGRGAAWAYVGVDDAQKLYDEWSGRDVKIRLPPTNYFWALEMHIEDPDGNVLRLGSDPLPDQPFSDRPFGN